MSDTNGRPGKLDGLKRIGRDKGSRKLLAFVVIVIVGALAWAFLGTGSKVAVGTSSMRSAPNLPSVQGSAPVTPQYERDLAMDTKHKADIAAATRTQSVTPPLVVSSSTDKLPSMLPGDEDERPPQPPVPTRAVVPPPAPVRPITQPGIPVNAVAAPPRPPQPIDQNLMQAMLKQMHDLVPAQPGPAQTQYFYKPEQGSQVAGAGSTGSTSRPDLNSGNPAAGGAGAGSSMASNTGTGTGGNGANRSRFIVPAAGTVLYAHLLGRVNSDTPGPVLGEVLQGPFAKSRLLGTFAFSEEGVVITFSSMTVPYTDDDGQPQSEVVPIHAIAVDSAHLGDAMATDIDRHLLEKIGVAFGTAFLQGIGQAVSQSGSTASYGVGGTTIANATLNTREQVLVGAGSAAGAAGQVFSQAYGNRRTTITVEADTPFGLLFLGNSN